MRYIVNWRQEGQTIVEAKDEEQALDYVQESIKAMCMPGWHKPETQWGEPLMLGCEIVDRGSK